MEADVELIASGSGSFEVSVDKRPVYSKKQTGEFPDERSLLVEIRKLIH
jgi:selenoprotein W-related protein